MPPGTEVSVGICAHNEEETIGTLLDQVVAADIPLAEVVVVAAGDDRTPDIVRDRAARTDADIILVEEDRREGQSAAQTRILGRVTGDAVALVDGDGIMEPGSLERLVAAYDGSTILYGREVPVTPDTVAGGIIDEFWRMHHRLSSRIPSFTTQLALIPADLVDRIPAHIVTDDEWLGMRARDQGYGIRYVPDAVKYHRIKGDLGSYLRHHRKNWAGLFQVQELEGSTNLQPTWLKARFYVEELLAALPSRRAPYVVAAGGLELAAFLLALTDRARGDYPAIWDR